MKRAFIASVVLWISASGVARACGLDDCALPDVDHLESGRFHEMPVDDWAWMNHDLALARSFLEDGDPAKARQIVAGLDYAIRLRAPEMIEARGRARVAAFHRALRAIQAEADGPALARLELRRLSEISGDIGGSSDVFSARVDDDGEGGEDRDEAADEARRERMERHDPERPEARDAQPEREPQGGPAPRW